ncbi:MAG TPA: hypothetical protein PKL84_02305, partial [Candidatus Hydrogenedentes bacterium]|nr:hypothetical protein [Candidatus Hydrogenedentota bacterium]
MGLRKILLFDLGRLLPSRKSAPEPPGRHWRDLWFVWLFARRREPRHETCYLPGRYYCRVSRPRRRPWRGPLYLRPRRWQQDLLGVVSELTAIVRVNASLPQGL